MVFYRRNRRQNFLAISGHTWPPSMAARSSQSRPPWPQGTDEFGHGVGLHFAALGVPHLALPHARGCIDGLAEVVAQLGGIIHALVAENAERYERRGSKTVSFLSVSVSVSLSPSLRFDFRGLERCLLNLPASASPISPVPCWGWCHGAIRPKPSLECLQPVMQPGLRVHHSIAVVPCPQRHLRAVLTSWSLWDKLWYWESWSKGIRKLVLLELRVVFESEMGLC